MRRLALLVLAVALPGALAAQSSQFGVRGLGIPLRPLSPRATATGGAFGSFDPESSLNPASIAGTLQFTSLFTTAQNFRSSLNPFGRSAGRDNRFPQMLVAGPVGGTSLAVAVSLSGYTDRNFSLGTSDSIDLRGSRVAVFDTLSSRGGLSDLRLATGWRAAPWLHLGLGLHAITGTNRIESRRVFGDSSYIQAVERLELSYLGVGVSAGALIRPARGLTLGATVRTDGHLKVDRDTTRIARTDLPNAFSVGLRWEPSLRTALAVAYQGTRWGAADTDLREQGGIGAEDAYHLSAGVELLRDAKNPGHRPIRLGGSYATLPFPLRVGKQAHEFGLSVGTGLRFTGGRGGVDLALQQLWRSDGDGFSERATVVSLGFSLRP
jgi:hypothetical protein